MTLLEELALMTAEGNTLHLPDPSEHKLGHYPELKKLLIKAGGTYKRSAFVFPMEPAEKVKARLLNGEANPETDAKKFQYFPTPPEVAEKAFELAGVNLSSSVRVLEPSAGQGHLLEELYGELELVLVEIMPQNIEALRRKGYDPIEGDFLDFSEDDLGGPFDLVLMNPPFSKLQDVDHVRRAYDLLKPGGVLVSIMSPSWTFNSQNKAVAFRAWVEDRDAIVEELEEGAFKASGTMVHQK